MRVIVVSFGPPACDAGGETSDPAATTNSAVTRRAVHRCLLRRAFVVVLVEVWCATAGAVGASHNASTRTSVVKEGSGTRLIICVTIVAKVNIVIFDARSTSAGDFVVTAACPARPGRYARDRQHLSRRANIE